MQLTFAQLSTIVVAATLAACTTTDTTKPAIPKGSVDMGVQVEEIMPGMLQGYLDAEEQLDSKVFVLPAPAEDSATQAMDTAWADQMQGLRGSPRWDLAARDADLHFPVPADVFSCALGIPVNRDDTPALYLMLWRTMTDLGLAPYSAKNAYQRERPFMIRGETTCTPQDEEFLREDGSYPSGHTAIGWGWALVLTELAPDRAEAILARGRSFGESRNVCNAHWYSDVVAGRLTGAAAVARLHAEDEFLSAMAAAGKEIARVREAGLEPTVDCAAEAEALATPLQ
ncbi:MAG: phosphatase PAP2 family protein [Xanthomonadales bacterium]|jgi:acid phosphatase (class A)|nr:phosphatase PAP2 family protein [Xanthomonadales bacterium]MDH3940415.1 phosphatase PAP2 family protein [Xanthomonadales bacterium]MDH4001930.1 phosphatase PAP2 family protein [Xanthomonadales bacterium]